MEAIVLAGGLGTRLRSVVSDLPKPMAPVNGRPFLEWLLEYWIAQGIRRFVISVGYLAEQITGHFRESWRGVDIAYATEPRALGTGGGLLLAIEQSRSENVVVMNGDSFFAVALTELLEFHRTSRADWSLSLFRSVDVKRYLSFGLAADGRILSLASQADGGNVLVNGGVYLIRQHVFRDLPWQTGASLSLETELLPHALRNGWRLFGREFTRPFVDIGVPEDYRRASALLGS